MRFGHPREDECPVEKCGGRFGGCSGGFYREGGGG